MRTPHGLRHREQPEVVPINATTFPPRPLGYFETGELRYAWSSRPSWWTRFWVRLLIGWKWRDA